MRGKSLEQAKLIKAALEAGRIVGLVSHGECNKVLEVNLPEQPCEVCEGCGKEMNPSGCPLFIDCETCKGTGKKGGEK